jgi:hypothetical protein
LMIPWISFVFVVISPFSFLILLIWVFDVLILVKFVTGLSILFIFSKNQLFVLLILYMVFLKKFFSVSISALIYHFSPSACLGFSLCLFFRSFRCSIKLLIWDLSLFSIDILMTVNFPLRAAFVVSHRFWMFLFSFALNYRNFFISFLISSKTQWLLSNVLVNFQFMHIFYCAFVEFHLYGIMIR